MCGIVGTHDDWLKERGLAPEAAMRAAVEELRWRGQEGAECIRIGSWWLGCARLAITQAGSRQPVVQRGRRYAAVLNGAITNARELWAELVPGVEQRAAPPNDAWLPLLALARGRRDLLARLRGHHAYAVVDGQTDEIVLGRDRYGEKPLLQLHHQPDGARRLVAFASTPGALRLLGMPAPDMSAAITPWLRRGFAAITPTRPQADLELVETDRAEPAATTTTTTPLRARVVASVRRCTDTTVTAGLFLSGGIDSSCLAASLHELGQALPAYQFHATGTPTAERDLARAVAKRCQLPFRPVDGGPDVLAALPQLTRCAGLPLGDPSVLAVHAVARAAAADGVRVMLGGEGADELFFGYRRYRALARLPRLPWLRSTAPRWAMGYIARWWRAVVTADPIEELLAVTPPGFAATVLSPALRQVDAPAPLGQTARGVELARAARDSDLENYLRLDLLPKIDIATMAAGIEARCPYLEGDPEPAAAISHDLGKRRLRAAFANDLPAAVMRQPKRGFSLPLDRWFRGQLPALDRLREPRTLSRPHISAQGVTAAIDRHRSGRANLGHGLYLLVAWEEFLRSQEQESPEPVIKPDVLL